MTRPEGSFLAVIRVPWVSRPILMMPPGGLMIMLEPQSAPST